MMSWMLGKKKTMPRIEIVDEQEDMDWEDRCRDEMLARVERKKLEWANTKMCRSVLMEVVNKTVTEVEIRHVVGLISSVIEESWKRIEVRRLVEEITNSEEEVQQRIESLLSSRRKEKEILLLVLEEVEAKHRRLKRIEMIKEVWKRKIAATNLRKMMRMLRAMSLEDLDMEVDRMEMKILETMEVEESNEPSEPVEVGGGTYQHRGRHDGYGGVREVQVRQGYRGL